MTILIDNQHPTLKLRLRDDGWCEDADHEPGEGPRFWNTSHLRIRGGNIRGGDIRGGTIWGGNIWGGDIRGGTIWGGTIRGGDIRGGDIRGGTIEGGNIWGGTIWGGTIRGGTIRGVLTAQRSDGYVFTINDDGAKIAAGCRYFTWAEAREHWRATRAGTPLGDETFRILDFLEAQARAYYPGAF